MKIKTSKTMILNIMSIPWYPLISLNVIVPCREPLRGFEELFALRPQEDDRGIADFTLVDFGVMFKFIEMEEAVVTGHLTVT